MLFSPSLPFAGVYYAFYDSPPVDTAPDRYRMRSRLRVALLHLATSDSCASIKSVSLFLWRDIPVTMTPSGMPDLHSLTADQALAHYQASNDEYWHKRGLSMNHTHPPIRRGDGRVLSSERRTTAEQAVNIPTTSVVSSAFIPTHQLIRCVCRTLCSDLSTSNLCNASISCSGHSSHAHS